ncbi:MAG: hypothetical protein IKR22_03510 [Clostridiales bacterium]|nr:hypothetical protein [Clostridiales bacterium]
MRFLTALDAAQAATTTETMDKTTAIMCGIGLIVAIAGIITFFILAFRDVAREYKKDDGAHMLSKKVLIRSTIFIIAALLCLLLFNFCNNYKTYYMGECRLTELIFACFVSGFSYWGWILLVPWLLNLFRKTSLLRTRDR